ncbi:hydrolase [Kitasatospora sp. NE20-6]|uniref:alpha/beta fold hydrolase n=1 Tax=Kitasatospora sp. NE20-6 TaxID=2859066 RepID=UPI0034DC8040
MSIFASYDGTPLWYDVAGDGPPLLALGGGPGTDVRYLGVLGGLDGRRTLVRMDGRAAGRSGVPADRASCAFTAQAADVDALRRHLGLDRVDVLGHSAGALTAQRYAAEFPAATGRLVLVTPVGRAAREPDEAELRTIRAARADEPWYPDAAAAASEAAAGTGDPWELAARLAPFNWGRWDDRARAEAFRELPPAPAWLRAAFYAGGAPVRPVDAPVLVVAGGRDGMIGTVPARLVAGCHPHARLEVLAEAGHRPWVDEPGRFRTLVEEFLTRGRPAGQAPVEGAGAGGQSGVVNRR